MCLFLRVANVSVLLNLMTSPSCKEMPSEQVQGMTHVWTPWGFLLFSILNMPVNSGRHIDYCSWMGCVCLGSV